jgi:formylglycine-generating enzyme required for sulfatase activity
MLRSPFRAGRAFRGGRASRAGRAFRGGAAILVLALAGCGTSSAPPTSTGGPVASSAPPSVPVGPSATAARTPGAAGGAQRTDGKGIAQVLVLAGTFQMGTDEADPTGELAPPDWARAELAAERPQHEVAISKEYWIDTTEVTNAAFQAFVDAGGYTDRSLWSEKGWAWLADQDVTQLAPNCESQEPDHPRVCVTWHEAEAYAAWRGGTLPTEAQWEFAARSTSSVTFPWGDEWDPSKANVVDSTGTKPVGLYQAGASWVGALDMAGNAMEWVADWFSPTYYRDQVRDDPTGPSFGVKKVEKGGWWGSVPYVARSAYRHFEDPPTYQDHHIGFRIVSLTE